MGFSHAVKVEALTLAARHCCVCNRYAAVGIEAHHILPKAAGGADTLENAIALCFDCHCAAGHYNPKHPRGTKYSPDELRAQRDRWHAIVEAGKVSESTEAEIEGLYVRHLVCVEPTAAYDLLHYNRDRIPFSYLAIQKNEVLGLMREVLSDTLAEGAEHPAANWDHPYFQNMDLNLPEFLDAFPEFGGAPERQFLPSDFVSPAITSSKLLRKLYAAGVPAEKLGAVQIGEYGCAGGNVHIYVHVRRPLFVFADIRNQSEHPISIDSIFHRVSDESSIFQDINSWDSGEIKELDIGNLTLAPGEALLVPECIQLGPMDHDPVSNVYEELYKLDTGQFQSFGFLNSNQPTETFWFGPSQRIVGVGVSSYETKALKSIHTFDPQKCYVLFRGWECGSCPHVYSKTADEPWTYLGEAFNEKPGELCQSSFKMEDKLTSFLIVETDFETTEISKISVDETLIAENIELVRGEGVEFSALEGATLRLLGKYTATTLVPETQAEFRQGRTLRMAFENSRIESIRSD